jgi:hypothetical protein
MEMLVPFKAVMDLGGAKGVMMYVFLNGRFLCLTLYSGRTTSLMRYLLYSHPCVPEPLRRAYKVPAVVHPMLYDALDDWGYDGAFGYIFHGRF